MPAAMEGELLEAVRAAVRSEVAAQLEQALADGAELKRRVEELERRAEQTTRPTAPAPNASGYKPLVEPAALAEPGDLDVRESPEEPPEVGELPESMFNYAVERLAMSPRPWSDPALGYLLLLAASQQLLMSGFSQVNFNAVVADHWLPQGERDKQLSDCVYAHRALGGQSLMFLAVSAVALVLVALVIKQDTKDMLSVMYPRREEGVAMWCLVSFVRFLQTVYLPGIFAIESAALFANSKDPMEVVMNTLAVTFILEVDSMLYEYMLDEDQKQAYQGSAKHPDRPQRCTHASRLGWWLFVLSLGLMCFHFGAIRFYGHLSGKGFHDHLLPLYFSYIIIIGSRGVLLFREMRDVAGDKPLQLLAGSGVVFVLSGVAGPAWFFTIVAASTGTDSWEGLETCLDWIHE